MGEENNSNQSGDQDKEYSPEVHQRLKLKYQIERLKKRLKDLLKPKPKGWLGFVNYVRDFLQDRGAVVALLAALAAILGVFVTNRQVRLQFLTEQHSKESADRASILESNKNAHFFQLEDEKLQISAIELLLKNKEDLKPGGSHALLALVQSLIPENQTNRIIAINAYAAEYAAYESRFAAAVSVSELSNLLARANSTNEFLLAELTKYEATNAANLKRETLQFYTNEMQRLVSIELLAPEANSAANLDAELSSTNVLKPAVNWTVVMTNKWVKPNDLIGRVYYLKITDNIYLWPTRIQENEVTFNLTSSSKGRYFDLLDEQDGITLLVGEKHQIAVAGKLYLIQLVEIQRAGRLPTLGAFFSVFSQ